MSLFSDDTQALDEVVVIVTEPLQKGSDWIPFLSVSAQQIVAIPVPSASEAPQGKMAGVSTTTD